MYSTYDIHNCRELGVSHLFAAKGLIWQGCCVSVQDWVQIGRKYQHLADILAQPSKSHRSSAMHA